MAKSPVEKYQLHIAKIEQLQNHPTAGEMQIIEDVLDDLPYEHRVGNNYFRLNDIEQYKSESHISITDDELGYPVDINLDFEIQRWKERNVGCSKIKVEIVELMTQFGARSGSVRREYTMERHGAEFKWGTYIWQPKLTILQGTFDMRTHVDYMIGDVKPNSDPLPAVIMPNDMRGRKISIGDVEDLFNVLTLFHDSNLQINPLKGVTTNAGQ